MRLTSLTLKSGTGVHLDGRTHYIVLAAEGWDIEVTPLGVVVTKSGKSTWIPAHVCESGTLANEPEEEAMPEDAQARIMLGPELRAEAARKGKKSALTQVASG